MASLFLTIIGDPTQDLFDMIEWYKLFSYQFVELPLQFKGGVLEVFCRSYSKPQQPHSQLLSPVWGAAKYEL